MPQQKSKSRKRSKKKSKKPQKYKLLLDEMLPHKNHFPLLNNFHNIKHIAGDFKQSGAKDWEVVEIAKKEGRLIITMNEKDFLKTELDFNTGVVIIKSQILPADLDKFLITFLRINSKNKLYGNKNSLAKAPRKRK